MQGQFEVAVQIREGSQVYTERIGLEVDALYHPYVDDAHIRRVVMSMFNTSDHTVVSIAVQPLEFIGTKLFRVYEIILMFGSNREHP